MLAKLAKEEAVLTARLWMAATCSARPLTQAEVDGLLEVERHADILEQRRQAGESVALEAMTDPAIPSEQHGAELNEQRLRLTAARERIDHAAQLLDQGDDWGKACACAELRLALRDLAEHQQPERE